MKATSTNDRNIPRVVAIVAMGPSHADYLGDCMKQSSRFRVADEVWAINAMGGILEHDRLFLMDAPQYFAKGARQHKHLEGYGDWLRDHPGPIYTSRRERKFPGTVDYPLEKVLNACGFAYFNNTVAYALAFAIHLKVPEVKLYGLDFASADRGCAEAGRACVEYWIATAISHGMKIHLSEHTTLCDNDTGRVLYGYADPPVITTDNKGKFHVEL